MQCKERLEVYLRQHRVAYQVQHHPVAYTAQGVAATEHVSGRLLAKVVMVMADAKLVMLTLPASYKVNLQKAAASLGAKDMRIAHEDEFAGAFPECEVGAMPPFGNLFSLPMYVDQSLTEDETIFFQAGTHADTMSMRYADYMRLVQPIVADFGIRP